MEVAPISQTEKDFAEFCSGEKDPLLDFIKEDPVVPTSSTRPSQNIRFENTYQLEPHQTFPYAKAHSIITKLLESTLVDVTYDASECAQLALSLSEKIKNQLKELNIPRYKLVSLVHIGQKNEQGLSVGSRCLWNHEQDTYTSANYCNRSLFAIGTVYACYFE